MVFGLQAPFCADSRGYSSASATAPAATTADGHSLGSSGLSLPDSSSAGGEEVRPAIDEHTQAPPEESTDATDAPLTLTASQAFHQ